MKVFLAERPTCDWLEDYAMVIIAKDKLRAEEKARQSSDDFKNCWDIIITEIDLEEEKSVLIANAGE